MQPSALPSPKVRSGLQLLLDERQEILRGRRVGLLVNPSAVTPELDHAIDRIVALQGVRVERLFGPEHGIRGEAQDMIAVDDARDPETGLQVISLYGDSEGTLSPPPGSLDGLDVLVYDVQDIGTRFYTYAATLVRSMEAAAEAGVQVVVCDRPNPLGGVAVEGPPLRPGFESFVGAFPLPIRHGLTVGEIAGLQRHRLGLDLELEVLPADGWRRSMLYDETGLPWVMPSPNMPTLQTAAIYPGMCLVEGTNLSEGRGTTRPFELVGAPYLRGSALRAGLTRHELPGLGLRACGFTPTFQKHAGASCGGVQLHVRDRRAVLPVLTGVAVLSEAWRLGGEAFGWRQEAYEFVRDRLAIDLLGGSTELRQALEEGTPPREIAATWRGYEAEFREERRPFLLYDA